MVKHRILSKVSILPRQHTSSVYYTRFHDIEVRAGDELLTNTFDFSSMALIAHYTGRNMHNRC